MNRWNAFVLIVFCLLSIPGVRVYALEYGIRELPTLHGDSWASAVSLSNAGQTLGFSVGTDHIGHSVEWTPAGSVIPLGYEADAMNNLNQTVGRGPYGLITIHDADGSPLATYENGIPQRINDAGAVLGIEYTPSRTGACYWAPDHTKYDIDPLPGFDSISLWNLNNNGQVVGFFQTEVSSHGFVWSAATGTVDIAVVTGNESFRPYAINDNGAIVGTIDDPSSYVKAAIWTPEAGMMVLAGLSSWTQAIDINNNGQVVGSDCIGPIYWQDKDHPVRLPILAGGLYGSADFINDNGVIVGWSGREVGFRTAVVWEPVPEPSCIVAVALGLLGAVWRRTPRN